MHKNFKSYFNKPHNGLLIFVLAMFVLLLVIDDLVRTFNVFFYWPPIDIPIHLISGMAVSAAFFWLFGFYDNIKNRKILSLFASFLTFVLWEIVEDIQEFFFVNPPHMLDYFFWDGFFDILWSFAGSIFVFWVLSAVRKKTSLLYHEKDI